MWQPQLGTLAQGHFPGQGALTLSQTYDHALGPGPPSFPGFCPPGAEPAVDRKYWGFQPAAGQFCRRQRYFRFSGLCFFDTLLKFTVVGAGGTAGGLSCAAKSWGHGRQGPARGLQACSRGLPHSLLGCSAGCWSTSLAPHPGHANNFIWAAAEPTNTFFSDGRGKLGISVSTVETEIPRVSGRLNNSLPRSRKAMKFA